MATAVRNEHTAIHFVDNVLLCAGVTVKLGDFKTR
jgi:hypothetical protein